MQVPRLLVLVLFASAITHNVAAATLVLVAGGEQEQEPVLATQAKLRAPFGVDFNRQGVLFLVEMTGQRVRAIDSAGKLTTITGTAEKGDSGDSGPATRAKFNGMHSLVVAPNGDIYVADTWNNRVRKIDGQSRIVTAFAGTGSKGFSGDGGPAAAAQFGGVYCLALAPSGDRLYLADLDNRRIRAVNLRSGVVETVAGNGQKGVPADGAEARQSPLVDPRAVAVDDRGNVYILERSGDALRVVDAAGRIRTVVGRGANDCRDENGQEPLPLKGPKHLCIDLDRNVLIADTENHLIRKFEPNKKRLIRVAGTGEAGAAGIGGPPLEAQLNQPHGVYAHPSGAIYIADSTNDRVVKIEL